MMGRLINKLKYLLHLTDWKEEYIKVYYWTKRNQECTIKIDKVQIIPKQPNVSTDSFYIDKLYIKEEID